MRDQKGNLPASVTARLLNRARETGDDYQTLLTTFCFERFQYRLGVSDVRERFVLKGAMLVLGDRNSRIKDFFDLHHLASRFEFDRVTLAEAVRRTFDRRRTPIPADEPIGLTPAYWENPSRPAQVRAFARRAGLTVSGEPGSEFLPVLGKFLLPIFDDLRRGARREGQWLAGGPWRPPAGER